MATEDNELVERLSKLEVNPDKKKKSEPIKPIEFTLCDSETSFLSATSFLEICPSIVIDCEGLNLGVHGGSLSLVCIRSMAPQKEEIFLFDIVALTCSLKPLFDILTNAHIVKVLYDGRMDFCALYHHYGVGMANVIDLQLADVKSRFIHQETPQQHIQRLGRCFPYKQLHDPRHAYKYEDVHVLQGLGSCLVDHQCTTTSPKGHADHDSWLTRPLSSEQLQYAAHDVELIDALYSHFVQLGYLDSDLPSQSQRYVSIWNDAPPEPDDIYRSHPLLPLDILNTNVSATTILCQGCARQLSLQCFPPETRFTLPPRARRDCWVCMAVPVWLDTMKRRREHREKRKATRNNEETRRGAATAALFGNLPARPVRNLSNADLPARPRGLDLGPSQRAGRGRGAPRGGFEGTSSEHPSSRGRGRGTRGRGARGRGTRGGDARGRGSRGTATPV